jgi:hypothetical protein
MELLYLAPDQIWPVTAAAWLCNYQLAPQTAVRKIRL